MAGHFLVLLCFVMMHKIQLFQLLFREAGNFHVEMLPCLTLLKGNPKDCGNYQVLHGH